MTRRYADGVLDDLIVLMPLGELGYQRYWQYLLQNPDFGYLIMEGRVITHSGGYVHHTPTVLIREALDASKTPSFKRVLWVEHDHWFPADVFRRHARYTQPIVGGLYTLRDADGPFPVIYKWDETRKNAFYYNTAELAAMGIGADDDPKRGLHKVDVVPMGCTSVRRDVFEKWPEEIPYFSSYTNPGGSVVGHDVFFCRVAQDQGWPIYVDTSLRVKHYMMVEADDSFFVRWWNQIGAPRAIADLESGKQAVAANR